MAENIKVAVRIRPPSSFPSLTGLFYSEELDLNSGERCLQLSGPLSVEETNGGRAAAVHVQNKLGNRSEFVFDVLFDSSQKSARRRRTPGQNRESSDAEAPCTFSGLEENSQEAVFERTAKPLCDAILDGFNATLLAYGQTGSGKTYTIVGPQDGGRERREERGVLPRALNYLFSKLPTQDGESGSREGPPSRSDSSILSWSMQVQFVEIYQEQIFDLLALSPAPERTPAERLGATGAFSGQPSTPFAASAPPSVPQPLKDSGAAASPRQRTEETSGADSVPGGSGAALRVRFDPTKQTTYVAGARRLPVFDEAQALQIFAQGVKNRRTAETRLNLSSSRSHAVFSIFLQLEKKEQTSSGDEGAESRGKAMRRKTAAQLHVVDLAGSERQKDTLASGDRLREAGKINYSLSVLSHVIRELVEQGEGEQAPSTPPGCGTKAGRVSSSHIPYRDSKLTFLLMDALGGTSKAALIATLSPSLAHLGETISTLTFASLSKRIKNKARANEVKVWDKASVEEMLRDRERQVEEVKRLRALLLQTKGVAEPASLNLERLSSSEFLSLMENSGPPHAKAEAEEERETNVESRETHAELQQRVALLEAALVQAAEVHRRDQVDAQKHVDSLQLRIEYYEDFLRNLQRQRSRDPESQESPLSPASEETERLRVELQQREAEAARLRACVSDLQEKERPLVALLILLQKHLKYREGMDRLAALRDEEEELLDSRDDDAAFYCRQQLLVELLEGMVNAKSETAEEKNAAHAERPTEASTTGTGLNGGEEQEGENTWRSASEEEATPDSVSTISDVAQGQLPTKREDAAGASPVEDAWERHIASFAQAACDLIRHVRANLPVSVSAPNFPKSLEEGWPEKSAAVADRQARVEEITAQVHALEAIFDALLARVAETPSESPPGDKGSRDLSLVCPTGQKTVEAHAVAPPAVAPSRCFSSPADCHSDDGSQGERKGPGAAGENQMLRELYEEEKRASQALRQQVRWLQRTCRRLENHTECQLFPQKNGETPGEATEAAQVLQEYRERVAELEEQVQLLAQRLEEKRNSSYEGAGVRFSSRPSAASSVGSAISAASPPPVPLADCTSKVSPPSFPFTLPLVTVFDGKATFRGNFAMVVSLLEKGSTGGEQPGSLACLSVLQHVDDGRSSAVSLLSFLQKCGNEDDVQTLLSSGRAKALIHRLPLSQVKRVSRVLEYGKKKNPARRREEGHEGDATAGPASAGSTPGAELALRNDGRTGEEHELSFSSYVYRVYFKLPIGVWGSPDVKTKWVTVAVDERALLRHRVTSPEACDKLLLSVLKGSTATRKSS
ncbi:UNVERIFIED_CONTAM: kinesin motor domain-containing protein [Hammondia hammondi]|eukprot:XP_008885185.1 kinesin motor domain-containing protein [Hammondia hammondi]